MHSGTIKQSQILLQGKIVKIQLFIKFIYDCKGGKMKVEVERI